MLEGLESLSVPIKITYMAVFLTAWESLDAVGIRVQSLGVTGTSQVSIWPAVWHTGSPTLGSACIPVQL